MRPTLPPVVFLPAAPMTSATHIYAALAISKQVAHLWRRHGFPVGYRDGRSRMIFTDDVAQWIERHGARVIRK